MYTVRLCCNSQKMLIKLQQTAAPLVSSVIVSYASVCSLGQVRRSEASLMTTSQKMFNTCFDVHFKALL
jgi:hypothetical protein